jgi:hypothetical protein
LHVKGKLENKIQSFFQTNNDNKQMFKGNKKVGKFFSKNKIKISCLLTNVLKNQASLS